MVIACVIGSISDEDERDDEEVDEGDEDDVDDDDDEDDDIDEEDEVCSALYSCFVTCTSVVSIYYILVLQM